MRSLVPAIQDARRELEADLARWVARVGGVAETYSIAQVRQLLLLLGIAEQQGKRRKASFGEVTARAIKQTLGKSLAPQTAVKTLLQQLDLLRKQFADIPPPQVIQAAWVAQGDKLLINRYGVSANRYAGQVRQDMQRQFAIGLLKQETVGQLVTRIGKLGAFKTAIDASTPSGAAGVVAGSLTKRYGFWAERVVRTELVHSYNFIASGGIQEFHKQDPRVLSMWDASLDMRVCKICRSLDGEKVTPGHPFPGGYLFPPAHPFCRCAVVAWIDGWEAD